MSSMNACKACISNVCFLELLQESRFQIRLDDFVKGVV